MGGLRLQAQCLAPSQPRKGVTGGRCAQSPTCQGSDGLLNLAATSQEIGLRVSAEQSGLGLAHALHLGSGSQELSGAPG